MDDLEYDEENRAGWHEDEPRRPRWIEDNGDKLKTIIVTVLITSLFWAVVGMLLFPSVPRKGQRVAVAEKPLSVQQAEATAPRYAVKAKKNVDYTDSVIGKWEPVEVSSYTLEISEFGTLKTTTNKNGYKIKTDYKYKLVGDRLGYTILSDFFEGDFHRIDFVTDEEGNVYLNIYDDPDLGGRYKLVSR